MNTPGPSEIEITPDKKSKAPRKAKPVYYCVRRGRQPGIYRKWRDCEAQILLFKGAEYRKFDDAESAQLYMGECKDFVVKVYVRWKWRPTGDIEISLYSDKLECEYDVSIKDFPERSYAILFAVSEFLQEFAVEWKKASPHLPEIKLYMDDIHAINVINRYIKIWKYNLWQTRKGPVQHVEMLKSLYEQMQQYANVSALGLVD